MLRDITLQIVNDILNAWANWCNSSNDTLYYYSKTPYLNIANNKASLKIICSDEEALLIEKCLTTLRTTDVQAYKIIVMHYVYRQTTTQIAKELNTTNKNVKQQLVASMYCLNDYFLNNNLQL